MRIIKILILPMVLIFMALCLFSTMPVFAMGGKLAVQRVYETESLQSVNQYDSFTKAFGELQNGDILEIVSDITLNESIIIPDDFSVTIISGVERESQLNVGFKVPTDENATTRTIKKNFGGSLFILGKGSKVTFQNIVLDGNYRGGTKGGLVYVKEDASLTLVNAVTLKNSTLSGESYGGAVYVEENGKVLVSNTVFANNTSSYGGDIYAINQGDVSFSQSVSLNFEYINSTPTNPTNPKNPTEPTNKDPLNIDENESEGCGSVILENNFMLFLPLVLVGILLIVIRKRSKNQ